MDLSIIIVTINRKDKVVRGIKSCLNSKLPVKTEFVIVDNGCVDDTETAVKDVLDKSKYNYHYIRFEENTGASFARNAGIKKASGEILFFMDDDACIADKNYDTFFEKGIEVLKNNSKIGSVTTAIWDETLKMYRKTRRGKNFSADYPVIYEIHGGSCFVRNHILDEYFPNSIKYGYEEIYTSLRILDEGYYNAETEDLLAYHIPDVTKYIKDGVITKQHYIKTITGRSSVCFLLYPSYLKPFVWIGCILRWIRFIGFDLKAFKEILNLHHTQCDGVKCKKIKFRTIIKLAKEFGIGITV